MVTVALYEPAQFEPLIDEPWVPARVEDAIAAIVSDADAAFDRDALWPAHDWDGWEEPLPLKNLWVGAAGVIWALDALRQRGHAETSLDLAAAALRTVELERAAPGFTTDEHYHPAALFCGETGPLLVASGSPPIRRSRRTCMRSSARTSPTRPTTSTGEHRARFSPPSRWANGPESAVGRRRRARRRPRCVPAVATTGCGGRMTTTAASARCTAPPGTRSPCSDSSRTTPSRARMRPFSPGMRSATVASPTGPDAASAARAAARWWILPQWCTGARVSSPGVEYLDEDLVLAGAELVWHAGATATRRGTASVRQIGQRLRTPKAFARTGDERWLERAVVCSPRARPGGADCRGTAVAATRLHRRRRHGTLRRRLPRVDARS